MKLWPFFYFLVMESDAVSHTLILHFEKDEYLGRKEELISHNEKNNYSG